MMTMNHTFDMLMRSWSGSVLVVLLLRVSHLLIRISTVTVEDVCIDSLICVWRRIIEELHLLYSLLLKIVILLLQRHTHTAAAVVAEREREHALLLLRFTLFLSRAALYIYHLSQNNI